MSDVTTMAFGPRPPAIDFEAAGVPPAAIHAAPWCTRCHPELFFSFRREKQAAGRQMAVIGPSA